MRDFNIDAMGVAWKESRQISVVPSLRSAAGGIVNTTQKQMRD